MFNKTMLLLSATLLLFAACDGASCKSVERMNELEKLMQAIDSNTREAEGVELPVVDSVVPLQ